jgi:hypothetical protein
VEKSNLKIELHTSVIFKTLPKANNHPIGENYPILVALVAR